MDVLACDRRNCHMTMCDRYSDEYGYICWGCFNELIAKDTEDIKAFMESSRSTAPSIDYNKVFPLTNLKL